MFLETLNEKLWILGFLPLFLLCALRLFPLLPRLLKPEGRGETCSARDAALRPAEAAGTVLAATVGTGNIVGTAQAVAMGGPGAVFWMWAAALLGCAVKAGEIAFGQRFGGAMGYIRAALGRAGAAFYALLALVSTLLVGNMAQVNASLLSLEELCPLPEGIGRWMLCLTVTALAGLCLCGGVSAVGRICGVFVPGMTGIYVLGALFVLSVHREMILPSLRLIVRDALSARAALGAAAGLSFRRALLWGLRRGAFSNEAGLGSAANIHAFADSVDPAVNARWGVLEVLTDTLLLCTLSALVILCSGIRIPYGSMPGPELSRAAFASALGAEGASLFVALSLAAFGFSTVLGCYVSGQRCAAWLGLGERRFRRLYLLCCFLGGLLPLGLIWRAADAANVLMAAPNLLALLLLAGREKLPTGEA
jgi:AGCS family alanine or glycine:cation symporter